MDGLSAAASIIAVINLAAKAATTIYSYSVSAKDCPDSVQHLQRELNAVKGILNELKTLAERLDRERCEAKPVLLNSHLFGEDEELAQCQRTVQQILDGLEGDWRVKLGKEWRVKLGRRLRWPIEEKNIMSFITQLERYKATFSLSLLAGSITMAAETQTTMEEIHSDIREASMREETKQLIDWLSPLQYNQKHEISSDIRQPETGTWLFEHELFKEWENATESKLWIWGNPGTGKTILASHIIDRLFGRLREKDPREHGFAYCYCEFRDTATTDPSNIIRTLLTQLLYCWNRDCSEKFADLFDKIARRQGRPSVVRDLTKLVLRATNCYRRSSIIIDGLDECSLNIRGSLLDFVIQLASQENINIIVISRKEEDIYDRLKHFPTISFNDVRDSLEEDMKRVIHKEFANGQKWARFVTMKDDVTASLIKGSGINTFRWLECQLEHLSTLETEKAIKNALQNLPITLFETYERILDSIEDCRSSTELARKAFLWLVGAERPLQLTELVEALALEVGDTMLDRTATFNDTRGLLRTCRSFVDHNEETGYISFCHYTVFEFFVSQYLKTGSRSAYAISILDAHTQPAKLTLTYLLLDDFSKPCTTRVQLETRITRYQLHDYCIFGWLRHIRKAKDGVNDLFILVDRLTFESGKKLCSHEQILIETFYQSPKHPDSYINIEQYQMPVPYLVQHECELFSDRDSERLSRALFYHIIRHDLGWITQNIIQKRPELLNATVLDKGTPLFFATLAGHQEMAKMLVKLGADVHKKCPAYDLRDVVFPLVLDAPKCGWVDIFLKYMPEPGIDPNTRSCALDESLLHTAAFCAPRMLPMLLKHSLDINFRSGNGSTALHHAVLANSYDAVKVLVQAGADIYAETNAGISPVHIALNLRSYDILRCFLDQGGGSCIVDIENIAQHFPLISDSMTLERLRSGEFGYPRIPSLSRSCKRLPDITPTSCLHVGNLLSRSFHLPENIALLILDYAEYWASTTVARHDHAVFEEDSFRSYISVPVQGDLRRISFRIRSHDQGWSYYPNFHGSYRLSYTWFEAHIIGSNQPGDKVIHEYSSEGRIIQVNVHASKISRDHTITWDARDPTLGMKEWLDSVRPGDIIAVYPRARNLGWENFVEGIEIDVFFSMGVNQSPEEEPT